MQHLVLVHIAIFMSLHGPAGACILIASVSPIYPIQRVLKHCGVHKHSFFYNNYIYARDPKQS